MGAELFAGHIDAGIVTIDRDAALAFWHGLMGFPVEGEISFPGLTILRLKAGDTTLRLCIPDGGVEREAHNGAFAAESGLRYLTIYVCNLDALADAAQAAGYLVPFPPREIRPGHRVAQIQDGMGVTVELVETSAG
ncbi:MAG: hypothetical protein H6918_00675 [Sphingomonadaceae bacterium]|nr:hypothetical protein [Sphingomonadaceae bacterium]